MLVLEGAAAAGTLPPLLLVFVLVFALPGRPAVGRRGGRGSGLLACLQPHKSLPPPCGLRDPPRLPWVGAGHTASPPAPQPLTAFLLSLSSLEPGGPSLFSPRKVPSCPSLALSASAGLYPCLGIVVSDSVSFSALSMHLALLSALHWSKGIPRSECQSAWLGCPSRCVRAELASAEPGYLAEETSKPCVCGMCGLVPLVAYRKTQEERGKLREAQ